MKVKVGDTFSRERKVTAELIENFAELSGDYNQIHLDDEFAKQTRFGKRIAHGMLSGAFISGVLGHEFIERRVVYLSQSMRFTAPVHIGDTVTTTATVAAIRQERGIVSLRTVCTNQDGKVVVDGEAVLMVLE